MHQRRFRCTTLGPRSRLVGLLGLAAVAAGLLAGPALAQSAPVLSLFAGTGATAGSIPGPAVSSPFDYMEGFGADANGNVYVADNSGKRIDKITPAGTLSYLAGNGTAGALVPGPALSSPLGYLYALTVAPSGDVFAYDYDHFRIIKIDPAGVLSIVAGNGAGGVPVAGAATSSPLQASQGLGADPAGNLYYQDEYNFTLWKITPGGLLSKIAGNGTAGTAVAGPALSTPLGYSFGSFVGDSAGNVYFGDTSARKVLKVSPSGTLSFVAGSGASGAPVAGPALSSPFQNVYGVAIDSAGTLYASDAASNRIVKITPSGTLSIVVGNGTNNVPVAGSPTSSPLSAPINIAVDGADVLTTVSALRVWRIGPPEPGAVRNLVVTPGAVGSATLSFALPASVGATPITGYAASTDGGASWQSITTTAASGQVLTSTLAGLAAGSTYQVVVHAVNASGAGPASTVAPVTLPAPAAVAPALSPPVAGPVISAAPAAASPFMVQVQFRVPPSCKLPCTINAQLFLADGTTRLGARNGLTIGAAGLVRFFVSIDKAALLEGTGTIDTKGYRTTQTRLVVKLRNAAGRRATVVKQGRLAIALGRIASGKLPKTSGRVF